MNTCNNLGMGWDCVEDVCSPLFHSFFEMYVIPKCFFQNFNFFTFLVIVVHVANQDVADIL